MITTIAFRIAKLLEVSLHDVLQGAAFAAWRVSIAPTSAGYSSGTAFAREE